MIDSAVILATGNPNHTSRLIQERPRAMLPALGKPMVVRVMEQLYRAGIRQFVVIVGLNEGSVASYLNTQWVPDALVEFVLQGNQDTLPDVLAQAARKHGKPFITTSYNSFTYERFIKTLLRHHEEYPDYLILSGARSTLSTAPHNAFAIMQGQIIQGIVHEPPAGDPVLLTDLAVCGHHFVDYLANHMRSDKRALYFMDAAEQYINADDPKSVLAETSWILRVERDDDLLTLNKFLLDDGNDAHILSELPASTHITPPVRIDPQVSVGQDAHIGPYVYLERGSRIGQGAHIRNAIILDRGSVAANETLAHTILARSGRIVGGGA